MRIESIGHVNLLIKKRKEIKDRLNSVCVSKELDEINCLKISVEIFGKDDWSCRYLNVYTDAKDIKITKYEAEHLLTMTKTYNEEELIRVENELKDLGVEIESKNSCDNETNN